MKEKNYEYYLSELHIDPKKAKKKRFLTLVFLLVGGLLVGLTYNAIAGVIISVMAVGIYKYEYVELAGRVKKLAIKRQVCFVNFFFYLLIFLENKMNIYQAISAAVENSSDELKPLVEDLLTRIDNDKTSLPYLEFANHFHSDNITQIMLLLYQYEQSGYDTEHLSRFSATLSRLKQNTYDEYVAKSISKLDLLLASPMIVSIALVLIFAIGVLDNIGGLLNV
jgi:hypothetical protein